MPQGTPGSQALPRKPWTEPAPRIQSLEGADGVRGHRAAAVGRPVNGGVVNDDEMTVGAALHVQFYDVRAEINRRPEGGEGVLRRDRGGPSVGDDKRTQTR